MEQHPHGGAYNRELLSLNARLSVSMTQRNAQEVRFAVREATDDTPILTGVLVAGSYYTQPGRLRNRPVLAPQSGNEATKAA